MTGVSLTMVETVRRIELSRSWIAPGFFASGSPVAVAFARRSKTNGEPQSSRRQQGCERTQRPTILGHPYSPPETGPYVIRRSRA